MSEATLWKYVRDNLLPRDIHATRIENGISAGFPDVHYTIRHESGAVHTGTLELKFLKKKNPPFGDDGLNRDQILWIRDELRVGGTVWIIADIGKHICMINGKFAPVFNGWDRQTMMENTNVIITKGKRNSEALEYFRIFL